MQIVCAPPGIQLCGLLAMLSSCWRVMKISTTHDKLLLQTQHAPTPPHVAQHSLAVKQATPISPRYKRASLIEGGISPHTASWKHGIQSVKHKTAVQASHLSIAKTLMHKTEWAGWACVCMHISSGCNEQLDNKKAVNCSSPSNKRHVSQCATRTFMHVRHHTMHTTWKLQPYTALYNLCSTHAHAAKTEHCTTCMPLADAHTGAHRS